MDTRILRRIERQAGVPDLVRVLSDRLSASDLQSLLLEVYRRRTAAQSPPDLLGAYVKNRFVRPSPIDPGAFRRFEEYAGSRLPPEFVPVELSPVSPLGACSSIATVDQNKVLSAVRHTEVSADSTNALALECAVRRRAALAAGARAARVRLSASHRLVRAQPAKHSTHVAHFRVFSLATAGRDEGLFGFETSAMREQIDFWLRLLAGVETIALEVARATVHLSDFSGGRLATALRERVAVPLRADHPEVAIDFSSERERGRGYYGGAAFQIRATRIAGDEFELADGGLVDWTQAMLTNRKERLLISGFGMDVFLSQFARADA